MPDELASGSDAAAQAQAEAGAAGSAAAVGPRIIVERPPPGLARGKYPFPDWGIGLIGAVVVLAGLAYLIWRALRSRRR
jgi:hypothetical protein